MRESVTIPRDEVTGRWMTDKMRQSNVFPMVSSYYVPYLRSCNRITFSQYPTVAFPVFDPNLLYLLFGKLSFIIFFSASYSLRMFLEYLAMLCGHIHEVVFLGSKEKMLRITADRIVARMQDAKMSWIATKSQKEGNAMAAKGFSVNGEATITGSKFSDRSRPTFVLTFNFNFIPKEMHIVFGEFWNWCKLRLRHVLSSNERMCLEPFQRFTSPGGSFYFSTLKGHK